MSDERIAWAGPRGPVYGLAVKGENIGVSVRCYACPAVIVEGAMRYQFNYGQHPLGERPFCSERCMRRADARHKRGEPPWGRNYEGSGSHWL